MMALVPAGVSLHFHRMVARGVTGSLDGQEARNRMMIDHLDKSVELLSMVKPAVIVVAHTATSYTLGIEGEAALLARLEAASGVRIVTAFGSVATALGRLAVERVALGAPYSAETTEEGRAHLEAHGFRVVCSDNLKGVTNIYDETPERAYRARPLGRPAGGAGGVSQRHRHADFAGACPPRRRARQAGHLVNLAMMWHALRGAGVATKIPGYGRLLTLD